MTAKGVSGPFRELRDRPSQRCLSCLSDPVRGSSLGLKVALVFLHVVFVGAVFLLDGDLIETTKTEPWYTIWYLVLFEAALVQYFATTDASPGAFNEANTRIKECSASSKALTCSHCSLEQPPRSKHCQECDKCVPRLDQHCVWLGTCIGQNSPCQFWWKEDIWILLLCGLMIILVFLLLLLFFHCYLVMINQTTYELVRRRCITYLRFCCARGSDYYMERVPTQWELEELVKPYTCLGILTCRCC